MHETAIEAVYELRGVVQGVGFRPAVFRLAAEGGLSGAVQNCAAGVRITIEGPPDGIDAFVRALPLHLPKNAQLDSINEIMRRPATGAGG